MQNRQNLHESNVRLKSLISFVKLIQLANAEKPNHVSSREAHIDRSPKSKLVYDNENHKPCVIASAAKQSPRQQIIFMRLGGLLHFFRNDIHVYISSSSQLELKINKFTEPKTPYEDFVLFSAPLSKFAFYRRIWDTYARDDKHV